MKIRWLSVVLALTLVAAAFAAFPAPRALAAGVTYTWNQTGSAAWTTAANWTPTRTTPATTDILVIDGSATASPTLTAVPTQTIGQLVLKNNTSAAFQASATATLTIGGDTGIDFDIGSGSSLTLSGSNAIQISLSTGTTGGVSGSMTVTGGAHRLIATDANGITMNGGASFTTGASFTGNAFGTGTANSVVFANGSTYTHNAGSNPFALTAPSSVVVFQQGSTAVYRTTTGYAASGRTFANLTVQNNTALSGSGTGDFRFQTLTVESGSSFTHSGSGTATVTVKGDISSAGTANVSITAGSGGIQVNGGTIQTFGGGGGSGSITFANALTVASGTTLAASRTLTANGAMTVNGSFQLNTGGWATGSGTWTYGSGASLIFNSSSSYGVNNDVYWPTSSGPTNVTVLSGGGISMNVSRTVNGAFQTAAGVINGNNLTLNGTTQINAGGYFDTNSPVYGSSSTLVYNPGGSYNIGSEWKTGGTVGSGVPKNVIIQNNTAVVLPNGAGSRTVGGNLTIGNGSSLTLGGNIGDDLNVGGNWVNNGTFNANNRAVTFTGTTTVSGSSTTSFAYVTINGTLTGHSGSMNVANDWTNNGAFNPNGGAVHFNGTGGQAIGGTTISSFFDIFIETFSSVTGPAGGTLNVAHNWTNNGTFNPNGGAVHFNGTGGQAIGGTTISSFFDVFIETFSSVTGPAGGTLNVAGNWTNNGAFNHNGGTVVFNGSTGQAIGGSAATTFNNLTINNASDVSLGGGQAVDAVLNLSAGRLTLGANSLTLGSGATVGGTPGGANMVVADGSGFLKKASAGSLSFTFPVGDSAGNYTPVALNCPALSSGSSVDVRLTPSAHLQMAGSDYIKRYWTMQSAATSVNCTGIFQYVDGDVVGNESAIRPVKYDTAWHALTSGAVDTVNNRLTGGFTSFSDFTGGNPAPLAVTLASMNAAAQGAAIQVTWETVSEVGNAGFNLYRDTSPAGPGVKLNAGLIPSQGPGSSGGFSYTYTDAAGLVPGTTYFYWLEDVNLAGAATRHEPVSVEFGGPTAVSLADFRATTTETLPRITRISRISRISVLAVFGLFLVVVGSVGGGVVLARRRG